jgi:hypothetical protein
MRGVKFRYKLNSILDGMVKFRYFEEKYKRKTFFMFTSISDTNQFYVVPFHDDSCMGMVYQYRSDGTYASIPFNVWAKVIELSLIEEFNDVPVLRKQLDDVALLILTQLGAKTVTEGEFNVISGGYNELKQMAVV